MQRLALIPALLASTLLVLGVGSAQAGNPVAGKEKSQTCAACHGETGASANSQYPLLAGQHESYLYHALKSYKNGDRQNPIMNGLVSGLSDQDMRDLAAYFARQEGLYTVSVDRDAGAE